MSDIPEISPFCEMREVFKLVNKGFVTSDELLQLSELYHEKVRETEVVNCKLAELTKTGGVYEDEIGQV